ncbi:MULTISPECIES: hypothetical protein [Bacteroides]|uniref:hypothetical protein n=1 Tax=Bacteroides TaxID=816 RepID=UPI0022A2DE55|nr:hypothetical protein [Bacteroides fragilis]MCY6330248.1 hypothetical protein [Bacteroides fragilis]WPO59311.1 hypothetical protein SGJ39_18265 [Bacteroides fragilis]
MEENKPKVWISDEIWDLMNDDITNYVFDQGEKYLADLYKISNTITARCYTLIGIIVAVYPFIITSSLSVRNIFYFILAVLFSIVCIAIGCYIVLGIVTPYPAIGPGSSPRERLVIDTLLNYKERGETNFKKYEIEALQEGIEYMEASNRQRAQKYKRVLYFLLCSLSVFLVIACIIISLSVF